MEKYATWFEVLSGHGIDPRESLYLVYEMFQKDLGEYLNISLEDFVGYGSEQMKNTYKIWKEQRKTEFLP